MTCVSVVGAGQQLQFNIKQMSILHCNFRLLLLFLFVLNVFLSRLKFSRGGPSQELVHTEVILGMSCGFIVLT